LTSEVTPFVFARLASWQAEEARHRQQFGDEAFATLEHFFGVVTRLFIDGKMGCARLTASSPT
jgi:hypothetical protein